MRTELCFEDCFVVCSVFIRGSIYPHSCGDPIRSWDTRTASERQQNHWNTQRIKWFPKYMGDYNHISQSDSVHRAVRTGLADGKVVVL